MVHSSYRLTSDKGITDFGGKKLYHIDFYNLIKRNAKN